MKILYKFADKNISVQLLCFEKCRDIYICFKSIYENVPEFL